MLIYLLLERCHHMKFLMLKKVANFIGKDDPISKLRDLADNTKQ